MAPQLLFFAIETIGLFTAVLLGSLASPMNLLRNMTPGLFMILCHWLFREEQKVPCWLLAAFAVQCCWSSRCRCCSRHARHSTT